MPVRRTKTQQQRRSVIVLGDWVIDEYWFLVRHHSRIASHTGFVHYRLSSAPKDTVADLCGAGHVARILFELRARDSFYDLYGIGNWNKEDEQLISHLLHARDNPNCEANAACFRFMRKICDTTPDIKMNTLAPDGPTIRVIRQYHRHRGGIEQLNRVDWELEGENLPARILEDLDLPKRPSHPFIIVNDLRKGVITNDVITQALDLYPESTWCIRSKDANPSWLSQVGNRLALLVVAPEVTAKLNPWDTWLTNGSIGKQAIDTIDALPGKNVILLSNHREVAGHLRNSKSDCIAFAVPRRGTPITFLGWPTSMFAVLTDRLIRKDGKLDAEDVIHAAEEVDNFSCVTIPGVQKETEISDPYLGKKIQPKSWKDERKAWSDAKDSRCGFLETDEGLRLDVWRGFTFLPGYIVCIQEKQRIISDIGRGLRTFKSEGRHLSSFRLLLQADPGAGKTFLARSFADALGFHFLRFDITQMLNREDLLEIFDAIATQQANDDKDILVFVDEINATLAGTPVYGAFLSPLEEGFYVRKGRSFSLRPCAWIFAGTNLREGEVKKMDKLSDFESRMTMIERIDFGSLAEAYKKDSERLQREARLEQVYLGAVMIHHFFSDVTKISSAVLKQFGKLDPAESPARKIRGMAEALKDVQYGSVSRINCESWKDATWEKNEDDNIFVHVHFPETLKIGNGE